MTCSAWGFLWGAPWGAAVGWGEKSSIEPDATILPIPAGCLDADKTARTRVWKQYTNADAATTWGDGIAALLGEAFAELESAASLVAYEHYVATARGVQLEEIGAVVGRSRGPLTVDDDYRLAIIVDAATTYASATAPEIIALATRLAAGLSVSGDVEFLPFYPAAYRIRIPDMSADLFALIQDIMADTPPAGVAAALSTYDTEDNGGWGSTTNPIQDSYDARVFRPDFLSLLDPVSSVQGGSVGAAPAYDPTLGSRLCVRSVPNRLLWTSPADLSATPFTLSMWLQQVTDGTTQFVLQIVETGGTTPSGQVRIESTNEIGFFLDRATVDLSVITSGAPSLVGGWHHVAVTYDNSGTAAGVTIYVDGVAQSVGSSADGSGAFGALDGDWTIGATRVGTSGYDGYVSAVRAHDQELAPLEVLHLVLEETNAAGDFLGPNNEIPIPDLGSWSYSGAVTDVRSPWSYAGQIGD